MTVSRVAGSLDGRTLSRWKSTLAAHAPQALWFGPLDLRHIEIPVGVTAPARLDPLHRLVLRAAQPGVTAADLEAHLSVGPLLGAWLRELVQLDLLAVAGDRLTLTSRGGTALASGAYPAVSTERRRFTFVMPERLFVPWAAPPGDHDSGAGGAEPGWVADCIVRPAEWKHRCGFPEDVQSIVTEPTSHSLAAVWSALSVIWSGRRTLAIVTRGDGTALGFLPTAAGQIDPAQPALRWSAATWDELSPLLTGGDETAAEDVGDGWRLIGTGRLRRAQQAT